MCRIYGPILSLRLLQSLHPLTMKYAARRRGRMYRIYDPGFMVAEIDNTTPYIPTMGRVAKIDTMSGNVKAGPPISEITYGRVVFSGEWRQPSAECFDMSDSFAEI